ncbi:MAG: DUF951 domain-containing protein [Chloroflexota bacterium]
MTTGQDGSERPPVELQEGDVVALRKPHVCGGVDWKVTRVGADIGLSCVTCGRVILLPRHEFRARLRRIVGHSDDEA